MEMSVGLREQARAPPAWLPWRSSRGAEGDAAWDAVETSRGALSRRLAALVVQRGKVRSLRRFARNLGRQQAGEVHSGKEGVLSGIEGLGLQRDLD